MRLEKMPVKQDNFLQKTFNPYFFINVLHSIWSLICSFFDSLENFVFYQ